MRFVTLLAFSFALFSLANYADAVQVGDAAPCVVLNQISPDGTESEHCIRDVHGSTTFKILEFFSATCSDCAANLPKISDLAARTAMYATTRLIGIDRSESLIRDYVNANRNLIQFEVAVDTNRDAKRAYDVIETPTLFVLDANNTVLYRHSGILGEADIAEIVALVSGGK